MFRFDNGKGKPIIEQLKSFPANANPFHHDSYHMGKQLDNEYTLMYSEFDKNGYVIIIEKSTGKRIELNLNNLFTAID